MKELLISLEEAVVSNTSLSPSLYSACTQLRDNLAVYRDRSELSSHRQSPRLVPWLNLQTEHSGTVA